MNSRQSGDTQQQAADKAGISVRTGRRIEKGERGERQERHWRTRPDPLAGVWESELVPLLEQEPGLTGITLWQYLDDKYPGVYPEMKLRTLQRRTPLANVLQRKSMDIWVRFRLSILQREAAVSDVDTDGKNTVKADFLLGTTDFTTIVEMKLPTTKIFTDSVP